MAVKKRDIVFMSKNTEGENTIDMPVTRLGNIEDDAEIKETPEKGDYIPIMDSKDGGQMKKFPFTPSDNTETDSHRFYETDVTLSGSSTTGIKIGLNVFADIYEITVNGAKRTVADGRIRITSFAVSSACKIAYDVLDSSEGSGIYVDRVIVPLIIGSSAVGVLKINFTQLTNDEKPFRVVSSEMAASGIISNSSLINVTFPFRIESN